MTKIIIRPSVPNIHRVIRLYPEIKLAICHNPKCASNSIAKTLLNFQLDYRRYRGDCPKEAEEYYRVMFVRNPWDRVVSAYAFIRNDPSYRHHMQARFKWRKKIKIPDFSEFVERICDTPDDSRIEETIKSQWLNMPHTIHPSLDFLGHLETIKEDWKKLQEMFPGVRKLMHTHKTGHRHYSTFYDDRLKDLVAERYKLDLEIFGYSFDKPP